MTKIIYIPGEIANAAIDEHGNRKPVTRTQHIFDDAKNKSQAEINKEYGNAIGGLNSQNYVTVDSFNALPAIGKADTVYRVSNWDGSQQDPTVYSEYAWNGSQYVHLSTKTQIGEVFDISAYHATGGELAKYADLTAALNGGANIPQSLQKGGMSIKFVHSSDNKYVQYLYHGTSTAVADFTNTANWEKMNLEEEVSQLGQEVNGKDYSERIDFDIVSGTGLYNKDVNIKKGTYNITVTDNSNVLSKFTSLYLNGTKIGYAKSIANPVTLDSDVTTIKLYSSTDPSSSGSITLNFEDTTSTISLDSKISNVASDLRETDYRINESWGTNTNIRIPVSIGSDVKNSTFYHVNIPKNTQFSISVDSLSVLAVNSIPIYAQYEDGTDENIGNITVNTSLTTEKTKNIVSISTLINSSNISSSGNLNLTVSINGAKERAIHSLLDGLSKKVEYLVKMGNNSAGHIWSVGEKMYNTINKKISICISEEPSLNFRDHDPIKEAVYIYNNLIYVWDGTDLIESKVDEDYGIILSCYGELSKDFAITQGNGRRINHSNNPDEALHFVIKEGEWFDIIMTTSVLSNCYFYADNGTTTERLYERNGHYIAPFDFNILGMYYTDGMATGTGNLKVTIKKISVPELTSEFKGNGNLEYFGQKIPSLKLYKNKFRCKDEILISENSITVPEGTTLGTPDCRYASGLCVVNDRIFNFLDSNGYCEIYNLTTLELIEKASTPWSAHNNNAQVTPYYYNANDSYPLMLVSRGDYSSHGVEAQKFYYVRVTESGGHYTFTIIKEVSYNGFLGEQYNCSFCADYINKKLYAYTYPNGAWDVTVDNPMVIHEFDLPDWSDSNPITLTGSDILRTIILRDHYVMQGADFLNGRMFMEVQLPEDWDNTINGIPFIHSNYLNKRNFIAVINVESGYIETMVPIDDYREPEGISIYDGSLYISQKYTNAPIGDICFKIVKYEFD